MNLGTVIKCCPLCGGRIVVSNLYQYSLDYTMRKDGKIGKRYKRGEDGAVDVSLASCENYKTCPDRHDRIQKQTNHAKIGRRGKRRK